MGRHDVSNNSDVTGKKTVNMNTTGYKNMQVTVGMTAKGQWDKIKAHCGVQRKTGRMSIIVKGVYGKVWYCPYRMDGWMRILYLHVFYHVIHMIYLWLAIYI